MQEIFFKQGDIMLQKIQPYINHALDVVLEVNTSVLHGLDYLVNSRALEIISKAAISTPLLVLHHNLFAFGLAAGFIYSEKTLEIVDKVNTVFKAQRTSFQQVSFYGLGGFLALLTMPTSMILATLYYSSQWGALIYEESRKIVVSHESRGSGSDE